MRAFWVGRGVTQGLSMHLARHTFATDLEVAMEAYVPWLEQQREDEIVPPEADR